MATQTAKKPRFQPINWLLSPLHLLERVRGWRRRLLILAYLIIGTFVGLMTWRAMSLRNLPDVGDPFDVPAFLKADQIPDDQNAFTLYREAIAKYPQRWDIGSDPNTVWRTALFGGWSAASPKMRAAIEGMRPTLAIWQAGTRRTKAIPVRLKSLQANEGLELLGPMANFADLTLIEGSRLESEGNFAAASESYQTVLRAANHMRMLSTLRWRGYAKRVEAGAIARLFALTNNPKVDAGLLRKMLDEVLAIDAAAPPISDNFKAEYLTFVRSLDEPEALLRDSDQTIRSSMDNPDLRRWYLAYWFMKREPERSLRVARLYFANHLAHCDKPETQRPPWGGNDPRSPIWAFYEPNPTAPAAARVMRAETFFRWHASTSIASHYLPMDRLFIEDPGIERRDRAPLIIAIADQLYFRDKGHFPAKDAELIGPYLKRLPEGLDAMLPADQRHK